MNLPKFLKNSIIGFSAKNRTEIRIYEFFENLVTIIKNAKINFEIYLNNLSYIKTDSERDYKKLTLNKFFITFPDEKVYFK